MSQADLLMQAARRQQAFEEGYRSMELSTENVAPSLLALMLEGRLV